MEGEEEESAEEEGRFDPHCSEGCGAGRRRRERGGGRRERGGGRRERGGGGRREVWVTQHLGKAGVSPL